MAKVVKRKSFSFGSCGYAKTSPAKVKLGPGTKILNVILPFEDALKFGLAVDECIRALNKYNRSTTLGKQQGLNVAIHLASDRITISEAKI